LADQIERRQLADAARHVFELGERLDWKSYDPYDVLLSPVGRIAERAPLGARVLLQLGKRSGANLRQVLRVPRHEEPKALADFLLAASMLAQAGEEWAAPYTETLAERLVGMATRTSEGYGWGINFPWVSRFGVMAAGEPNIYTTTVACQALLDAHELTGRASSLQGALDGTRFICDCLGTFVHRGRPWLRYSAGSTSPIVNIQASSAALFARVHRLRPDERLLDLADAAADVTVSVQRPDGSWPYADDGRGDFVDGFHTGFTLQGLRQYDGLRGDGGVSVAAAVESGFTYFKHHLLTDEGRPRGFADGSASSDGQTVAQAIQTLVASGDADDLALAGDVWRAMLASGRLERPFPALRWTLGPFVVATASLLRATVNA
jgi:polysaccharide biosynthesis protein VpsJ